MKPEPKKIGICYLCGQTKPLTRDHIPPECLFEKPLPSDLITVPCCEGCRQGWSNDDEYFRTAIVSCINTYGEPKAQQAWNALLRSVKKPRKKGFAKGILQNVYDVEIESEGGLYLGEAAVLTVDKARIDRVSQRIVLGLFFHVFRYPLPPSHEALCYLRQFGFTYLAQELNEIAFPPSLSIGNGTFEYSYKQMHETTAWIGTFYGTLPFIGFTRPRPKRENKSESL